MRHDSGKGFLNGLGGALPYSIPISATQTGHDGTARELQRSKAPDAQGKFLILIITACNDYLRYVYHVSCSTVTRALEPCSGFNF